MTFFIHWLNIFWLFFLFFSILVKFFFLLFFWSLYFSPIASREQKLLLSLSLFLLSFSSYFISFFLSSFSYGYIFSLLKIYSYKTLLTEVLQYINRLFETWIYCDYKKWGYSKTRCRSSLLTPWFRFNPGYILYQIIRNKMVYNKSLSTVLRKTTI